MTHQDRPHATVHSRGWACVETVRSGSKEPAYLTLQLYTSASESTTGSGHPVCHRLAREPEKRPVQSLAHGVVVTVEAGLPLSSTPACNDVHRRRLYLGEVRFDPGHLCEVRAETLSVGEVPRSGDHLATVVFPEVSAEDVEHAGRCCRDVADPQALDLSDRAWPEDRGDHDQIGTHFADSRDESA